MRQRIPLYGLGVMILVLALSLVNTAPLVSHAVEPSGKQIDVLIGFRQTPGPNEHAIVRGRGGNIKHSYDIVPAVAASIPEAALNGLRRNPNITAVELDGEVQAIDAELDNTWGVKRIGAGTVQANGNTGGGVGVAVIDSGIDYNHPDLNANYAGGYDFVNNDSNPMDDNGHGTHVSGTVAAEDDDSGVVGTGPTVRIYALKVLNANGSGNWSKIIAAVQWAVDHGVKITNNSYGSSSNPGTIVETAFRNAENAGVFHAAAAGNSGNCGGKGDRIGYPAKYGSVVAVGAVDKNDKRPCFSSTGPKVELAAPGVAIKSTLPGGNYAEWNGTSMASPHVAGTAALVMNGGITDSNSNGRVNDEIRERLRTTAQDLGSSGRDSLYGYGLVKADAALGLSL